MHPFFNPTSADYIEDPYPFYRQLRESQPYYRSPFGFFAVSRDADVRAVTADKRFGRDFMSRTPQGLANPDYWKPVMRSTSNWILFRNPPDHTRLRGLVSKAFTARRVQELRPRIEAIVEAVLDRMAGKTRADLVADFAAQIPSAVICELLGIPQQDRETIRRQCGGLVRLLDPVPFSPAELASVDADHRAVSAYLDRLLALRRRAPQDDLTTQLVLAEEQGERLSAAELTDNVILLFVAGFETTEGQIGNGLAALMRHPEQLARLRAEQSLLPNAIEECLRYDSSVQLSSRLALEEIQLGEVRVPRGGAVVCVLGAANRDPAVYDDPERFDIARRDIRHVAFGGGIHHCLGAQLARLEAEIAIGAIIRRFPDLRLDDGEKPAHRVNITIRAFARLPVLL